MSHQVVWTKIILERFIEQANLTEEEELGGRDIHGRKLRETVCGGRRSF